MAMIMILLPRINEMIAFFLIILSIGISISISISIIIIISSITLIRGPIFQKWHVKELE